MSEDKTARLQGLGISGYRSFGPEPVLLYPFSKINVLIGRNNSGKSNVLRFVVRHLPAVLGDPAAKGGSNPGFDEVDWHQPSSVEPSELRAIGVFIPCQPAEFVRLAAEHIGHDTSRSFLEPLSKSKTLRRGTEMAWFAYEVS